MYNQGAIHISNQNIPMGQFHHQVIHHRPIFENQQRKSVVIKT